MDTGGASLGIPFEKQEFDTVTTRALTVTESQTVASQAIETLSVTSSAAIGNASTDTVGFYGATVTTQPLAITSVTTTAATSTTPYGYSSTQADGLVTAVNALIVKMRALGLIAT